MKKVLWVSRHYPLISQRRELQKLFGESVEICFDGKPFTDAEQIITRFRKSESDELVLVAPLSVCKIVLEMGVKPLWAEMRVVDCGSPDVEVRGNGTREKHSKKARCYKFVRFRRLESIDMVLSDLRPE